MKKFIEFKKDCMQVELDEYIKDLKWFQKEMKKMARENKEEYGHLKDPVIDYFWPAFDSEDGSVRRGYLFPDESEQESRKMKLSEYIKILNDDLKNNGNKIIETAYKFYIKRNINGEFERDGSLDISVVGLARF